MECPETEQLPKGRQRLDYIRRRWAQMQAAAQPYVAAALDLDEDEDEPVEDNID